MATKERLIIESLFQIINKHGEDVPFLLNHAQATLDNNLTGRDIVPKARQLGISQYFLARYLARCLSTRNTRAVVISHDREATERALGRVHYMLDNLRGPKAVTSINSKSEIVFPKTNSTFFIGTAGARKFGRGDTITNLHCSEAAFWDDPKSLTSGLFQAVPLNGEIAIESTGNGTGNWYHRQCMRAYEGKSRYRLHFFSWLDDPEYVLSMSAEEQVKFLNSLSHELEELELYERGISLERLAFRRDKLTGELDMDLHLWKQEYPETLDECFQASGYSFFSVIPYRATNEWRHMKEVDKNLWALEDEYKHHQSKYALGVDVGGGVRRNRSVIQVIDIFNWKQVAEWVSDTTSPDILAKKIIELGHHFNDAFVTVETNNHGAVTLLKLIEGFPKDNPSIPGYPEHLLFKNDKASDTLLSYGYKTSVRTRPIIIGGLRKEFLEGFVIHSPATKDELNTFVEDENGKLVAAEGCFDDRVLSLAVGVEGARTCPYIYERADLQAREKEAKKDLFDLDTVLAELRSRHSKQRGDFPIPFQDEGSYRGNPRLH
jgi:hypothetical protein